MRTLPLYKGPEPLAIEREAPAQRNPSCTACALHSRARTVCMPAAREGTPGGPVVYVLGMGPGEQEDRVGVPNVGASGAFLRDLVKRYWPGEAVYDNAVRCAPGKKVPPAAIKACRAYGAQYLAESRPSRILALGSEAVASLLGAGLPTFSVRRGYTYTSDGVPVFFLLHPAAALRNRFVKGWFDADLKWALTCDLSEVPPSPKNAVAFLVETETDAQQAIEDLRMADVVTWDLETYGAAGNDEFRILDAAAVPGGCDYAYVWERAALDNPRVAGPLVALLADPEQAHGGQNVKFDESGMRQRYKVIVRAQFDTMIWRRLVDGDVDLDLETAQALVGMLGGKAEAEEYVKRGVAELRKMVKGPSERQLKKGFVQDTSWWHSAPHDPELNLAELELAVDRVREGDDPYRYAYAAIPPEVRAVYNALDTLSTDKLRLYYEARFAANEAGARARRVWDEVARGMAWALASMEANGVRINKAKTQELRQRMAGEMAKLEAVVAQYNNGEPINLNSSDQVAALLFDRLKLPASRVTEKAGKRSTAADVVEKLDHPAAKAITEWRTASKFKSQYADGLEEAVRDDGRVHANTRVVGTGTGRPSCTDPNLFNLRRPDDDIGVLVRDCLEAEDGYEFVEVDQSQVELRVAGMLSGDEAMIDAYIKGLDMHLESAKYVAEKTKRFDPATITKKHPLRSQTKSIVFGALYGEPAFSQAQKLGITKKEAEALQKLIMGRFPKLARWIQTQLANSRRTGDCHTYWNGELFRRRPLTDIASPEENIRVTAERSAWNTPIQGTAADYTNASLWAIQAYIERENVPARLVLTVYDSILLEVRKDWVIRVAKRAKQIMESWPTMNGMPLKGECKRGKAYGSMQEFEPDEAHEEEA